MPRLAVVLACVAVALTATPAGAAGGRKCPQPSPYELVKVKHVRCARAADIVAMHFDGDTRPAGLSCSQKRYPGGVATECRKRIKHFSAD